MPFTCSICAEDSTRICVRCTKDACDNHLCEKCRKCSDCCECEVALSPHAPESVREAIHPVVAHAEPVVEAPPAAEVQLEPVQVEPATPPVAEAPTPAEPVAEFPLPSESPAEVTQESSAEAMPGSEGSDPQAM